MTKTIIGAAFKPGLTFKQLAQAKDTLRKLFDSGDYEIHFAPLNGGYLQCDFVVAYGGDGTMLGVLRDIANEASKIPLEYPDQPRKVPVVVGVNMGTVGFITDIPLLEADDMLVKIIHDKQYLYEARGTLSATVNGHTECAANDILLQRAGGRLLDFDVELNGVFAYSCRADGLLISTPTGSTAYSLAAGGPIIGPCVEANLITPMMPQNLSSRPLIVTADTSIVVRLTGTQRATLYIDGNETECPDCIEFKIEQGPYVYFGYHTANSGDRDFTLALRSKLGWNS